MTVCLATNNLHKIDELQKMLPAGFEVKTLQQIGCFEDIAETGSTFQENSLIKAKYVYDKYRINTLADDSGLEVEALDGRPGVYSARYAGEPSDATANNQKLIAELKGIANRKARFYTVITLIIEGEVFTFDGEVRGSIKNTFDGEVGFGYNPIFIPEGYSTTFHELDEPLRLTLNHRGRAMEKLRIFLENAAG